MHIKNFTAGTKKFHVLNIPNIFYLIKDWGHTTTHEIHLRLRSPRYRTVTLSNQSYFWNVNLPMFTGVQSVFAPGFGSVHMDTQSYRSLTFPIKTNKRNLICLQNSTTGTAEGGVNFYC